MIKSSTNLLHASDSNRPNDWHPNPAISVTSFGLKRYPLIVGRDKRTQECIRDRLKKSSRDN